MHRVIHPWLCPLCWLQMLDIHQHPSLEGRIERLERSHALLEGDVNMHLDGFVYNPDTKTWVKAGGITWTGPNEIDFAFFHCMSLFGFMDTAWRLPVGIVEYLPCPHVEQFSGDSFAE